MKRLLLLALPRRPMLRKRIFNKRATSISEASRFLQTTYNDSGHLIGEALIRYDVIYGLAPGLKLTGGTETRMRHTPADRAQLPTELGRSRPPSTEFLHSPLEPALQSRADHPASRKATHPLGQGRYPQSDRSFRPA